MKASDMNWRLVITSIFGVLVLCGCSHTQSRPLPNGKVLLGISISERERLVGRLGFTNGYGGYIKRDSEGERLVFSMEEDVTVQPRTARLVVVAAKDVHVNPWRIANERMADDESMAVWQNLTNGAWQVRSGEQLPKDTYFMDQSGEWILLGAKGRRPWLAKLDTPTVVSAELPQSGTFISIFANGQIVHVFARRGWRNAEGPMKYLVYDFSRVGSQPIKEMTLLWARAAIDMDPETEIVILNDNNNFWGKTWLMDLKTDKRTLLHLWGGPDWELFVKKEVALKWIELTQP